MGKLLYYDCFSGISGDMNLGALIDLGVDQKRLVDELKKLKIGDFRLDIKRDSRKGIAGTKVDVVVPPNADSTHHHTSFREIRQLIEESGLSEKIKKNSLAIFTRLAVAEAKIHDQAIEDVAFHEVGAVDSIVDIVGAAICLDDLQVDRVLSSPVQLGGGFVKCAHGTLPVPAPATVELLKGIPVKSGLVPFETTTPTGAAILAATVDQFTDHLDFVYSGIGYGIGGRDLEIPNVLRVFLGEVQDSSGDSDLETAEAFLLETNIDDMSPESYDFILESLFAKGAHDVFLTPIIMKKSRPAVKISVLCSIKDLPDIEEVFWLQTTTVGVRYHKVGKDMLRRDMSEVDTPYGKVSVKNVYYRGRQIKSKPEYEDCKKLAQEKGVSIRMILDSIPRKPDI